MIKSKKCNEIITQDRHHDQDIIQGRDKDIIQDKDIRGILIMIDLITIRIIIISKKTITILTIEENHKDSIVLQTTKE